MSPMSDWPFDGAPGPWEDQDDPECEGEELP